MTTTRRGFLGLFAAFLAFVRLALPRLPLDPHVIPVPQPIVDQKDSGNFWITEEAPGKVPVTTYANLEFVGNRYVWTS